MGITYENQRVVFDTIVRRYKDYIALYRLFNNGSVDGLTSFDEFYWRMVYVSKYQDRKSFGTSGY
jgi:hypothetical protein